MRVGKTTGWTISSSGGSASTIFSHLTLEVWNRTKFSNRSHMGKRRGSEETRSSPFGPESSTSECDLSNRKATVVMSKTFEVFGKCWNLGAGGVRPLSTDEGAQPSHLAVRKQLPYLRYRSDRNTYVNYVRRLRAKSEVAHIPTGRRSARMAQSGAKFFILILAPSGIRRWSSKGVQGFQQSINMVSNLSSDTNRSSPPDIGEASAVRLISRRLETLSKKSRGWTMEIASGPAAPNLKDVRLAIFLHGNSVRVF